MACASWPAVMLTQFLYVSLWAATIVLLILWEDSRELIWPPLPLAVAATLPASGPGVTVTTYASVSERSLGEVWADWHRHGSIGDAEALFGLFFLIGVVGMGVLAWLYLPTVHAGGRIPASFGRAFKGMACFWGPVLVATVLLGTAVVQVSHASIRGRGGGPSPEWQAFFTTMAFLAAAHLLALWLGRAMAGVAGLSPRVELPPTCEGCGYNLTHVPGEGRCPECGMEAALSLTPGLRRSGWAWESAPAPLRVPAWFEVNRALIQRPNEFYENLEARSDCDAPARFVRLHMILMGVYTAIWIALMFVLEHPGSTASIRRMSPEFCLSASLGWLALCLAGVFWRREGVLIAVLSGFILYAAVLATESRPGWIWRRTEFFAIASVVLVGIPGLGWLIHRVAGAVAAWWWLLRGELSDPRAARKVMAYEAVFLWAFWFWASSLITSFFMYSNWLSQLFGRRWMAGLPIEAFVFFTGVAVLLVVWVLRYARAGRAVRWANF